MTESLAVPILGPEARFYTLRVLRLQRRIRFAEYGRHPAPYTPRDRRRTDSATWRPPPDFKIGRCYTSRCARDFSGRRHAGRERWTADRRTHAGTPPRRRALRRGLEGGVRGATRRRQGLRHARPPPRPSPRGVRPGRP